MPWYVYLLIGWIALDRLLTVLYAGQGKVIEITNVFAAVSLVTGTLMVWAIISLAGA
jgi:hypothetical protein